MTSNTPSRSNTGGGDRTHGDTCECHAHWCKELSTSFSTEHRPPEVSYYGSERCDDAKVSHDLPMRLNAHAAIELWHPGASAPKNASVLHCKYCTVTRITTYSGCPAQKRRHTTYSACLHRSGGMKPGCLPSDRGRTHDLHWLSRTDTVAHDLLWLSCTEAGV